MNLQTKKVGLSNLQSYLPLDYDALDDQLVLKSASDTLDLQWYGEIPHIDNTAFQVIIDNGLQKNQIIRAQINL